MTTTTLPNGEAIARVIDGAVYLTGWGKLAILAVVLMVLSGICFILAFALRSLTSTQ